MHDSFEEVSKSVGGEIGKLLRYKSKKREKVKRETLKAMINSFTFGCTLQVLYEKTDLSKTTLKRYLDKLISLGVLRKEFDMYVVEEDYKRLNPFESPHISQIWDKWQELPEYVRPDVLLRKEKGKALYWGFRGKESDLEKRTRKELKEKIRQDKKKETV